MNKLIPLLAFLVLLMVGIKFAPIETLSVLILAGVVFVWALYGLFAGMEALMCRRRREGNRKW